MDIRSASPGDRLDFRKPSGQCRAALAARCEITPGAGGKPLRPALTLALAALAYGVAIVYLSWPIATSLGTGLIDPMAMGGGAWARADLDLVVWILSWDAHALATNPTRIFDANIFYPAPNALASSEHLLGLAPIATPTFLFSENAILTYNVTVLATVFVTALSLFVLVRAWTASNAAAFLTGAAFTFSPLNLMSWTRLHVTAVHLFPLVLLFAWKAAVAPRARTLAPLTLVTALQLLAGVYVAYELLALLVAFAPALWWEARRHGRSALAPVAAVAAGALALVPVVIPYLRARSAGVLPDYTDTPLPTFSALPLASMLRDALTWPVIALAALGALGARSVPWHLRAGLVLITTVGIVLSLGPTAPLIPGTSIPGLFALATKLVPGFSAVRGPSRFLVLSLLALALLGGIGAASIARAATGLAGRGSALAVAALTITGGAALIHGRAPAEALPLAVVDLRGDDMATYRWLTRHADGSPVLELPVAASPMNVRPLLATGRYMVGSTLHWSPLVNGYSGHPPPSHRLLMTLAQRLPDPVAFTDLCALVDLGWILVHFAEMPPGQQVAWRGVEKRLGIARVWSNGDDVVYRVRQECGQLEDRLRRQLERAESGAKSMTLRGTPREPLPAGGYRGRVEGEIRRTLPSGFHVWFWVTVTNTSRVPWPGLSARPAGTIALQARWRDAATGSTSFGGLTNPLARDLAPGESILAQVGSMVPQPGEYVLEIGLLQEGVGRFDEQPGGTGLLRRRVLTRRWAGSPGEHERHGRSDVEPPVIPRAARGRATPPSLRRRSRDRGRSNASG